MIFLGADHGGYELKKQIQNWLNEWSMPFEDLGANEFNSEDDYPEFAFAVAEKVAENSGQHRGILACRSAAGVVIAANKIPGVRAVAVSNMEAAKHSRAHNDANVIGLSGDWMTLPEAEQVLKTWLTTDFSGEERHQRRIQQIIDKESKL